MIIIKPTPLVSVCIFTYNRARFLKEALDCFVKQISEIDQPVEVVISDNHSTDETEEVVKLYQSEYPYIVYSRNEENIGPNRNMLKAVTLAQGEYAWLFCDDDLIRRGALKKVLDVIAANPDVHVIHLNYSGWTTDMRQQVEAPSHQTQEDRKVASGQEFLRLVDLAVGLGSSVIARRSEFLQTDPEKYFWTYLPHVWAVYRMAINRPCYYIAFPYLMRRVGDPSLASDVWPLIWPLLFTLYFPQLLNDLVPLGYPRQDIDNARRKLMRRDNVAEILLSLRNTSPETRRQFRLLVFVRLHWRYAEFWYHLLPTLVFRVYMFIAAYRFIHWLDARTKGRLLPLLKMIRSRLIKFGVS